MPKLPNTCHTPTRTLYGPDFSFFHLSLRFTIVWDSDDYDDNNAIACNVEPIDLKTRKYYQVDFFL